MVRIFDTTEYPVDEIGHDLAWAWQRGRGMVNGGDVGGPFPARAHRLHYCGPAVDPEHVERLGEHDRAEGRAGEPDTLPAGYALVRARGDRATHVIGADGRLLCGRTIDPARHGSGRTSG